MQPELFLPGKMDEIFCSFFSNIPPRLQEEPHPFATAMTDFLIESGRRSARPSLVQAMMTGTNAKYEEDQRIMNSLVDQSESVAKSLTLTIVLNVECISLAGSPREPD